MMVRNSGTHSAPRIVERVFHNFGINALRQRHRIAGGSLPARVGIEETGEGGRKLTAASWLGAIQKLLTPGNRFPKRF
jgi:hypothetical protein